MGVKEKVFKASLVDLRTGESREFQYNPESWTDERSVNFATVTIPGISYPRYQFIAGGETVISFKLFFNALNHKDGGSGILKEIMWIRSRTYPHKSSNIIDVAPSKMLFIWPGLYSSTGLLAAANIEYTSFFPDGKPKNINLNVEFKKQG